MVGKGSALQSARVLCRRTEQSGVVVVITAVKYPALKGAAADSGASGLALRRRVLRCSYQTLCCVGSWERPPVPGAHFCSVIPARQCVAPVTGERIRAPPLVEDSSEERIPAVQPGHFQASGLQRVTVRDTSSHVSPNRQLKVGTSKGCQWR